MIGGNGFDWRKLLRVLVCLLVVFCLLVNMGLPEARAIAVADDIAIGITACLILMAAGVVFAPKTAADITAIGNSMSTYMYQWGTEAEKTDEVESWLGGLTIYNGGSDEDGDGEEDTPHQRQVTLARGILGGITAWVASVIMGTSGVSVSAGDGYRFYGDHLLPFPLPDSIWTGSSMYLFWNPVMGKYYFYELPTYFLYNVSGNKLSTYDTVKNFRRHFCEPGDSGWTLEGITTFDKAYTYSLTLGVNWEFLWGSRTISYDSASGNGYYYLYGSKTPQTAKELAASKYLGDIPTGIQDGTLTADGITLPDVLDYSELVPLGKPATDAVIDTSNDLIDGTLPYEDYLQQITGDTVIGVSIVAPDIVTAGSYITIQVDVSGSGDFDTACTCTLSGAASADTVLTATEYDNTWTLSCGVDETAQTLTVTVQSMADASITAVKEITVRQPGSDEAPDATTDNPPDADDSLDTEKQEAFDSGNSHIGDLTDAIPDYSDEFSDELKSFTESMMYTGTDAVIHIPAVMFPQLGALVPGFQMVGALEVDFGEYVRMMPDNLLLLVQSLFTIALIVYCFKEFYDTIAYVLILRGG